MHENDHAGSSLARRFFKKLHIWVSEYTQVPPDWYTMPSEELESRAGGVGRCAKDMSGSSIWSLRPEGRKACRYSGLLDQLVDELHIVADELPLFILISIGRSR